MWSFPQFKLPLLPATSLHCLKQSSRSCSIQRSSMSAAAEDNKQARSLREDELDQHQAQRQYSLSVYQLDKLPTRRLSRRESRSRGYYGLRGMKVYKVQTDRTNLFLQTTVQARVLSRTLLDLLCRSRTCRYCLSRWRSGVQASRQRQLRFPSLKSRNGTAASRNSSAPAAQCSCSSL